MLRQCRIVGVAVIDQFQCGMGAQHKVGDLASPAGLAHGQVLPHDEGDLKFDGQSPVELGRDACPIGVDHVAQ